MTDNENTKKCVKDLDSIFGTSISLIKTYSVRYRLGVVVCIILDIVLMVCACIALGFNADIPSYFVVCFALAILINLLIAFITKSDYKEVFLFYRKFRNSKVVVKKYNITDEKLFATLFCAGYLRIKPDQTRDTYIEAFRSACCQNYKYSRRIMKYLSRYEDQENGNLEVYVTDSKKSRFVDIKEEK